METTKNIYQTLNAIMKEVGAIEKNQENKAQGFKFRGIDQFMNELHPLMGKHGLIAIPTFISSTVTPCQSKNGASQFRVTQQIKYTFYALDGTFLEAVIEGEAIDTADKGSTKAMSSALKYLLMQVFMIPTKDLEDADSFSPEIGAERKPMVIPSMQFTDLISDEIYATTNTIDLADIWRKYASLKTDAGFKGAVTAHGEMLNKPKQVASAFLTPDDFYAGDEEVPVKPVAVKNVAPTVKPVETFAQRKERAATAIGGNRR